MHNKAMKAWMSAATSQEQETLAKAINSSRGYLYQLSSGERTASAEKARAIELAATTIRRKNKSLPVLLRTDLCPACRECEYAKQCGG